MQREDADTPRGPALRPEAAPEIAGQWQFAGGPPGRPEDCGRTQSVAGEAVRDTSRLRRGLQAWLPGQPDIHGQHRCRDALPPPILRESRGGGNSWRRFVQPAPEMSASYQDCRRAIPPAPLPVERWLISAAWPQPSRWRLRLPSSSRQDCRYSPTPTLRERFSLERVTEWQEQTCNRELDGNTRPRRGTHQHCADYASLRGRAAPWLCPAAWISCRRWPAAVRRVKRAPRFQNVPAG